MTVFLVMCDIDYDPENIDPYKSIELGSFDYLNCYFTTISNILENKKWGSRFPILMESFESKTGIDPESAEELIGELAEISDELKNYTSADIVCNGLELEDSEWMMDAPFDTSSENLYDYFQTAEETNLTKTLYEYASEAFDENMCLLYIFQ